MQRDGERLGQRRPQQRQSRGQRPDHVVFDDQQFGGAALAVRERGRAAEVVAAGAKVRTLLEAGHRRAVTRGVHRHR